MTLRGTITDEWGFVCRFAEKNNVQYRTTDTQY